MTNRLVKTLIICTLMTYALISTSYVSPTAVAANDIKNVILIGWDGVQRNHLFELMNRGNLSNLKALTTEGTGTIVNITVTDHRTDTKSGWTQIMTGYRWWRTGVYNNVYWFHSIPTGYTIPERVESYFGKTNVVTAHITGKRGHMEVQNGTGTALQGKYTSEAIFSHIPSQVDVCNVGDRSATVVGPLTLQFIGNYSSNHFFAFFHFSDPDSAGHNQQGGENSALYEQAIERCDYWLGQIINKLNTLNIIQETLIYVTADHGFDENGKSHNYAPYVFLATNDKNVKRNGDEVDVAPTIYYGLGMWSNNFAPALDGYPLQVDLPTGIIYERQIVINDTTSPPKASITSPTSGADVAGIIDIAFKVSDKHLSAVLILIDNTLRTDGPWTWNRNNLVEASGSYNWDTTNTDIGSHAITILAFDEHGATNSPSNSTIKVNVVIPLHYMLTTSTNYGTVSPSSGLYDMGTIVTITATHSAAGSGERYVWLGWAGSGSLSYTGLGNPASVTMNGPIGQTASWKHEYYLTVTSPYGNASGQGWYDSRAVAYATVTSLIVNGSEGIRYVFTNWSGDASGTTSPSNPITMNAPKTATANYKEQFLVVFQQTGIPDGVTANIVVNSVQHTLPYSDWFDKGSNVTFVYEGVGPASIFTQNVLATTSNQSPLVVGAPATITGSYQIQYSMATFAVISAIIVLGVLVGAIILVKKRKTKPV